MHVSYPHWPVVPPKNMEMRDQLVLLISHHPFINMLNGFKNINILNLILDLA